MRTVRRHGTGGGKELFGTAVDETHRFAGLERERRGIGFQAHGVLAAETGADFAADDANLIFR